MVGPFLLRIFEGLAAAVLRGFATADRSARRRLNLKMLRAVVQCQGDRWEMHTKIQIGLDTYEPKGSRRSNLPPVASVAHELPDDGDGLSRVRPKHDAAPDSQL
jgi:hypothetical protein